MSMVLALCDYLKLSGFKAGKKNPFLSGFHLRALRAGNKEHRKKETMRPVFTHVRLMLLPSLYAYWITVNYRERPTTCLPVTAFCLTTNQPRRGETFVTRKITRGLSNIAMRLEELFVHTVTWNSLRDWGHAKDLCVCNGWCCKQEQPEDFVIAPAFNIPVRQFIEMAARWTGCHHFVGKVLALMKRFWLMPLEGNKAPGFKNRTKHSSQLTPVTLDPQKWKPYWVILPKPKKNWAGCRKLPYRKWSVKWSLVILMEARKHALLKDQGYNVAVSRE